MTNLSFIMRELRPHRRLFTPLKGAKAPFISERKKGIALALFLVGSTCHHCSGAEPVSSNLLWSAASYILSPIINAVSDQIPEETKNNIYKMTVGNPKDFDEVLKEFTFNRWKTELRDLIEKKIFEMNKLANDLSENQPIRGDFNFQLPKVSEYAIEAKKYSFRHSLATLSLDYTHECKLLIEGKIADITPKVSRLNNSEEKIILDYLIQMKRNLCGKLYQKFYYERGGGAYDRYNLSSKANKDRKKYWGWSDKPPVNNSSLPTNVSNILYGDGHLSITNYLQKTWDSYLETIAFLETKEIDLVDKYYNHQLDPYYENFLLLFEKHPQRDILTCKLIDDFDKKFQEGWIPPLHPKTAPINVIRTNTRPLPMGLGRGHEITRTTSSSFSNENSTISIPQSIAKSDGFFGRSDSFSEQSSSLPVNLAAAVEKHYNQMSNKQDTTSPSPSTEPEKKETKKNTPPQELPMQTMNTTTALPDLPTPTFLQIMAIDDYKPQSNVPLTNTTNTVENTVEYTDSFSDSQDHLGNSYGDHSDSYSTSDESFGAKEIKGSI